ncbi:hypothetical protein AB0C70_18565 [Streptomyces sp. NPDC048564]|uniref:hypothetical protein n=1 Tax=Streptomyces sp. NPDC048564 TaxID=3155760 RepID=UPI00341DDB38
MALLAPVASASDMSTTRLAQASKSQGEALTPAGYLRYLQGLNSAEAGEVRGKFEALSADEQTKFVNYLQDNEVYKAFTDVASGGVNASTPGHVDARYNADVSFSLDVKRSRPAASTRLAHWDEKATYTFKQKVLGVTVTTLQVWVRYQNTRGEVTKVYNSGSGVKNFNAAVVIDGTDARPWKAGGKAHAETVWKGSIIYKGFAVRIDKKQSLVASWDGKWKGSLKNI